MKDQLPQLINMHILIPGANTLRFFTGRGYERQKALDPLKWTIFQSTEEGSFSKKTTYVSHLRKTLSQSQNSPRSINFLVYEIYLKQLKSYIELKEVTEWDSDYNEEIPLFSVSLEMVTWLD